MSDWKKHLKSQMEDREITPSNELWDRLEAQLDSQETPTAKPYKLWLSIAASLLILLSVSYFLFKNSPQPESTIVQHKEAIKPASKKENIEQPIPKMDTIKRFYTKYKPEVKIQEEMKEVKEVPNIIDPASKPILASPKTEVKEIVLIENEIPEISDTIDEKEIYEKMSTDELLALALKKRALLKQQKIAINADKLLRQIEDEIYEEKSPDLLDRLTNQLKSIQMALAERNEKE